MPADGTIGFGILGAGTIADFHKVAIESCADLGARLVATGDSACEQFEAIERRFGVQCLLEEDMLQHPDIDVICICTPSGAHAAQAIAAAHAGKHVLVEKPMALTPADADAMIEACAQAGVKLGVSLQRRTRPVYRALHAAIQAGDLGDLTLGVVSVPYFRAQSYFEQAAWRGTWAQDGGVLMNQAIHLLDLLLWFMGDPVNIQVFGDTLHRAVEVEDTLAATLRFANGALATLCATTTAAPGFAHRVEIYGTRGGVRTEGDELVSWSLAEPEAATVAPPAAQAVAGAEAGADPRAISTNAHSAIYRDFVEAIREGREPMIDGPEGRRSVAAVDAIYRAAGLI